jgi:hypothetical protein
VQRVDSHRSDHRPLGARAIFGAELPKLSPTSVSPGILGMWIRNQRTAMSPPCLHWLASDMCDALVAPGCRPAEPASPAQKRSPSAGVVALGRWGQALKGRRQPPLRLAIGSANEPSSVDISSLSEFDPGIVAKMALGSCRIDKGRSYGRPTGSSTSRRPLNSRTFRDYSSHERLLESRQARLGPIWQRARDKEAPWVAPQPDRNLEF